MGVWIGTLVEKPKALFGNFAAGIIRPWCGASGEPLRDAHPDETIDIGEGIETCLLIALTCPELRVLVTVSLGNMASVLPPDQFKSIFPTADNDKKLGSQFASQHIVERHLDAGRDVRAARPAVGDGFNDTLRA